MAEEFDVRVFSLTYIDENSAGELIRKIVEINMIDDAIESVDKTYERYPITLVINSPGGEIQDGLGIIAAIENSKTKINTICYGRAMSMALHILAVGHYRTASKYATLMYHEAITEMHDVKIYEAEDSVAECKRLDALCDSILIKKTKIKSKELALIRAQKKDYVFDAKFALEKGIIDEII